MREPKVMCGWSYPLFDDAAESFEAMADEMRASMADGVNESSRASSAKNPGAAGLGASSISDNGSLQTGQRLRAGFRQPPGRLPT